MKEKSPTDKTVEQLRTEKLDSEAQRPGNEAAKVSRKSRIIRIFVLIGSGLLYSTIFPPLNWSFLAWIALIPLFLIIRKQTMFNAWKFGLIWGYFWAVTSFFWLREIEFFIPYVMAFILGMFPACWAMLIPVFYRNIITKVEDNPPGKGKKFPWLNETSFIIVSAAWWCLLEWIRSWIFTGLPWNFLCVSQWQNIPLIQIVEYTGVYGISFLLVYFNIALAFAAGGIKKSISEGKYRRPVPVILGFIVLIVYVLVGAKSMMKYRNPYGPKMKGDQNTVRLVTSVIQGDIPQCRIPKQGEAEFALAEYLKLSKLAVIAKPDVVIWPETAVPIPYFSGHPFGTIFRFQLSKLQKESGIPLLFGTIDFGTDFENYRTPDDIPGYNAVFLLDGKNQVVDRYYKQHLVPWGEYTPYGRYYPWVKKMFGMGRDLTPGKRYTLFELKEGVRAGAQICFEDIFPYVSRGFVKRGANLLVVLTNDAWYPKSSESEQHLANSIFRAIENRRPMIRAGNNNCSCLILPNGAIADSVSVTRKEDGAYVIDPQVPSRGYADFELGVFKDPAITFYTEYGDVFILFCSITVLLALLQAIWEWRQRKEKHLAAFDD